MWPKVLICLIVLLAVIGIIAYKKIWANTNNATSKNIAYFSLNRFMFNTPVDFTFGQPPLETTTPKGKEIQDEQNLGEYIVSLDELNLVAADKDVVFVFIPGSGNVLFDIDTKTAVLKIQQSLQRSRTTAGLYTLWCESPDYSKITELTRLPVIVVARKGRGTITMPVSNLNEYILFQAYQRAKVKGRCEYYIPNCC
jgi:hypothetical protein